MPKVRVVRRWLIAGVALLGALACSNEPIRPPNLLLISIDTLRADQLGCHGNPHGLTPNLDAFAEQSSVFTAAFAPAPFTLGSVGPILTGRYPAELGIATNRSTLPSDVPTLAARLGELGYRTAAVVSNYVLRRGSGVAAGFDRFDDRMTSLESQRKLPERRATETTDAALRAAAWLQEGEPAPSLLWVHYQDPHGPYAPPPGYREAYLAHQRNRPDGRSVLPVAEGNRGLAAIPAYQAQADHREPAWYRSGYQGEIRYTDEEIGRLLDSLTARGNLDETMVAIVADHGEGLGELDYWFAHGEYLNDALVRIPLMLRVPGREPERRHDTASTLDLFATLLARAGGDLPPDQHGRDLLDSNAASRSSRVFLSTLGVSSQPRHGLVDRGYKLLLNTAPAEEPAQLYRLGDATHDRIAEEPLVAEQLRTDLEAFRAANPTPSPPPPLAPHAEERAHLRALGYLNDD